MLHPSHPHWLDHPNNIWWSVEFMNLLICTLLHNRSKVAGAWNWPITCIWRRGLECVEPYFYSRVYLHWVFLKSRDKFVSLCLWMDLRCSEVNDHWLKFDSRKRQGLLLPITLGPIQGPWREADHIVTTWSCIYTPPMWRAVRILLSPLLMRQFVR